MAKRYHQSMKSRMAESRGMEREIRHEELEARDYYSGMSDRRRLERQDASMIHEDHTQIANLPQEVIMKAYHKPVKYMPEHLDDTIHGIDRQMSTDNVKKNKHLQPEKY